ncbi:MULTISPECIES: biotin/lipoyl-containing protein [Caloramator]|uniref:Biotin carboxyl carrier protein n=1 Tax=Caloramator proteoclasticus DSM 10124 TaxID=1121262 RepID=A0A1M4YND7_9CLOT|nr:MULTISPECIES: biotin/lipoyl-containing protein [Caloramator]SHF07325.1 biotin carboxyl carrier protein [Caloramator proteoclasticus DSM 10124]
MKKYIVTINGKKFEVEVEEVSKKEQTSVIEAKKETAVSSHDKDVKAPMPGTILDVKVKVGDKFKKGDVLFILEAMKMENEIMAGEDGVITEVLVSKGNSVSTDEILAKYK